MKNKLFIIPLLLLSMSLSAQNLDTHKKMFQNAIQLKDASSAIIAAQYIIAQEGWASTYVDSLAVLYYSAGNMVSCLAICEKILSQNPNRLDVLEVKGKSLLAQNRLFEAIEPYEKLFKSTNDISYGYTLAKLQYSGKRLMEALVTVNNALEIKTPEGKADVKVVEPTDNRGGTQSVVVKAALHNLRGLVVYDLNPKNNQIPLACFEEALKLEPAYALAKQNKETLTIVEDAQKNPPASKEEKKEEKKDPQKEKKGKN